MSEKKKQKNKTEKAKEIPLNISFPDTMSQEEIKNVIVESLLAYDLKKQEIEQQNQKKEQEEWREKIGYKDYSDKKWLPKIFLTFFNRIGSFLKIIFMPKKKISGDHAISSLMKIAVSLFFTITKWALWLVFAVCVLSYPIQFIALQSPKLPLESYPTYIALGLLAFLFAQMFRIASIEVEKIKDHNYIVDIFAAVAAVIAIIVSLIIR